MTPYTNRESFVWTCTVHTISALFCTVSFVLFRYFDLFFLSSSSSFYSCHLLAVAFRFSWTIFIFIENHVFSTLQRHRIKHFTQWIDHVWSNANTCMSARECVRTPVSQILLDKTMVFFFLLHIGIIQLIWWLTTRRKNLYSFKCMLKKQNYEKNR